MSAAVSTKSATHAYGGYSVPPGMRIPLILSFILHIAILIVAIKGLPYFKHEIVLSNPPISVEFVNVSDKTTTNKPPIESKTKKEPEKPSNAPAHPVAPKVNAEKPPKLNEPKPPKLNQETAKDKAPPMPKPKTLAPAPVKAPEQKPKPPAKAEPPKDQQDDFESVLKNLAPDTPSGSTPPDQADPKAQPQAMSPLAQFAQQMSVSEMDALRQQLSQCWNITAGARYAEDLVVQVRLVVNPDRTVREARVLDQGRYNQDTYFRAAADSAIRAVYDPYCNPLNLPPGKYEQWNTITINFDPREMLQ